MPTRPLPLTGAPTTDAVAVPCSSSSLALNVWVLSGIVLGRPANSSCARSTPESIIVTGNPGPGAVQLATPTCDGHHSCGESGSVNMPKKPLPSPGFAPIGRSGVTDCTRPRCSRPGRSLTALQLGRRQRSSCGSSRCAPARRSCGTACEPRSRSSSISVRGYACSRENDRVPAVTGRPWCVRSVAEAAGQQQSAARPVRTTRRTEPDTVATNPGACRRIGRMTRSFVGLGANLDDPGGSIERAVELLGAEDGVEVIAVSTLRETDPVGYEDQPRFLNGAVELRTTL